MLACPRKTKAITASQSKYLWRKTQQTSLDKDTPFAFAFAPTIRENRTVHIASFVNPLSLGSFTLSLPQPICASTHISAWQSPHRPRRHPYCHCWNGMRAQYIAGWYTLGYHNMKMSYMVSSRACDLLTSRTWHHRRRLIGHGPYGAHRFGDH